MATCSVMTNFNMLSLIQSLKTDWKEFLEIIYKTRLEDFEKMDRFLDTQQEMFMDLQEIYPPRPVIFKTFDFFNVSDLKIVILGQDPYHGPKQAMGMCFSVPKSIRVPPSLVNIYKEIKNCYPAHVISEHGDLTHWNKQGILLLNTSLTVRQASPNSHSAMWRPITNSIIQEISDRCENIIFLLWGTHARSKKKIIDLNKHYILESKHPSPLSANRGGWFGCNHFKKVNDILETLGKMGIKW